jgi:site-specific recombinase XerD
LHDSRQLAGGFASYQQARGFSTETIRVRLVVVHTFATWLEPMGLLDVHREHVEGFLADRKRCQDGSKNSYLSHLRAFYHWAMREGRVEIDPTALIDRARTRKRLPRPITEADFFQAVRMADRRMRAWLLLAGVGGLRCKEIAGLQLDDLWWDAGIIVVSDPKGNEERTVPMHPVLELALRDYGLPLRDPLFPCYGDPRRGPLSRKTISRTGNAFLRDLGIPSTMHKLRTRFGTLTYRNSRDLLLVAKLMGHKSTATTEAYVAFTPGADAVKVVTSLPVGDQHPTLFDA